MTRTYIRTFRLTETEHANLKKYAENAKETESSIIRTAIMSYMNEHQKQPTRRWSINR